MVLPRFSSATSGLWLLDQDPPSSDQQTIYDQGSFWMNTTSKALFICINANPEALQWTLLT